MSHVCVDQSIGRLRWEGCAGIEGSERVGASADKDNLHDSAFWTDILCGRAIIRVTLMLSLSHASRAGEMTNHCKASDKKMEILRCDTKIISAVLSLNLAATYSRTNGDA